MNAEERFTKATEGVETLTQIANNMLQIGIYEHDEHHAMEILMDALTRAMKVLDPDRYREYLESMIEEGKARREDDDDDSDSSGRPVGQYL